MSRKKNGKNCTSEDYWVFDAVVNEARFFPTEFFLSFFHLSTRTDGMHTRNSLGTASHIARRTLHPPAHLTPSSPSASSSGGATRQPWVPTPSQRVSSCRGRPNRLEWRASTRGSPLRTGAACTPDCAVYALGLEDHRHHRRVAQGSGHERWRSHRSQMRAGSG